MTTIPPSIALSEAGLPTVPRVHRQALLLLAGLMLLALGALYVLAGVARPLAMALGGLIVAALVLWDLRIGLGLFIFLAGLSPEFSLFAGTTMENLRLEDFLFPVLLLSWLLRILVHRERPVFRTPLTVPMVAVTLWGLVATLLGVAIGTVPHASEAFFRFAKYTQYYLIFFLVYNNVRSFADIRRMTIVFIMAAAITGLLSIYWGVTTWQETGVEFARASGPAGENYNTLVGYLMQGLALATALALSSRGRVWRIGLGVLALAILAAVLYTHSREGYVMLAATALFLAGKQYRGLILLGLLVWLASPILLPESVNERFSNTLHQIRVARTDSPGRNSLTARLYAWRYRWNGWFVKHPVQGNGIGSIPFTVDNQYLLTLVEVGIIGFGLFLWLLARLWKTLSQASRALAGTFPGVLAIGALGALVALLVQGWAATSFATIRTMEPWWFLCALTMAAAREAGQLSSNQSHGAPTAFNGLKGSALASGWRTI